VPTVKADASTIREGLAALQQDLGAEGADLPTLSVIQVPETDAGEADAVEPTPLESARRRMAGPRSPPADGSSRSTAGSSPPSNWSK